MALAADDRDTARSIGLPAQLVELLHEHREEQERERLAARQLWHDGDWLFANPTGQVLNSRTDTQHWKGKHSPAVGSCCGA